MQKTKTTGAPQAFFYALVISALIFLPFVIYDGGYFIYYGDFNVQQIPFYKLAHEAVREGDIFWSWHTDLGANFVGSYSFYLLFSPFFWLTLPFPTDFLPHLMAPLLALKTACAALTAYLYLRRMVRGQRSALVGAMLYAFSGWMAFNAFFNHFHDVAVFFPLLLLGLEKLVTENKRGLFAAAVLVNAMVNYWFFIGEVVFVILYVILRATDRSWGLSFKKFCLIALESVLGVGLAAAFLLPSALTLLDNPRTGPEELLTGWSLWLYWHEQRQPAILQSLFFPPELVARPNFLPDHGAKWASLSGWLPLFSLTGVLAYFFRRRDDWLKKLLALCLVFALVPGFNSLFILLNDSYYARWFYMPLLLMALATVRALEDCTDSPREFRRAFKWTFVVLAVYTVASGLTPNFVEDKLVFGLANDLPLMWVYAAIALVCLVLAMLLVLKLRSSKRFFTCALAGVLVVSFGFQVFYIANGKNNRERSQWLIDHAINGRDAITLPTDGREFCRIDTYDTTDNLGMYWRRPSIQAFHSVVPASIMEFYPEVGVTRDVASRPEADLYALRPLLSVRWLFIEEKNEEQEPMSGYSYHSTQNGFHIYENDNFLPLGFSYDHYVTVGQMEEVAKDLRSNLMLRAVVLDDEAALRYSDILVPLDEERLEGLSARSMPADVEQRRLHTADSVHIDNTGFTVTTSFDTPRLLFLSVPHEPGWSARVLGGEELRVEKVNLGFLAVRVPAGAHSIRFDYETPGLRVGLYASGGALLALLIYLLSCRALRKRGTASAPGAALPGAVSELTWEQYRALYGDKKGRAARLQRALNEAAARQMDAEIPPEEQTLSFNTEQHILENADNNTDDAASGEDAWEQLSELIDLGEEPDDNE